MSGRNPRLAQLLGGKPRMLVLNKIDLADEKNTKVSEQPPCSYPALRICATLLCTALHVS